MVGHGSDLDVALGTSNEAYFAKSSHRWLLVLVLCASFIPFVWGATACRLNVDPAIEGFPCNPDGSCDQGLVCVDDICV